MKKLIAGIVALALIFSCAAAEVIPPVGMGQIGYQAVVLCESLTVRAERSTSAKAVTTLKAGDLFATSCVVDGWRDCFRSESGGRTGWVRAEYVACNPCWYVAEQPTPVYAWGEVNDCRVGLLEPGERYPILKTDEEWLVIGLRGASGWILDAKAAQVAMRSVFDPAELYLTVQAEVTTADGGVYSLSDTENLQWIRENFAIPQARITGTDCPFNAVLVLTLSDGRQISLELATDSCNTYRTETGEYYRYGKGAGESSEISKAFWQLFGLDVESLAF